MTAIFKDLLFLLLTIQQKNTLKMTTMNRNLLSKDRKISFLY